MKIQLACLVVAITLLSGIPTTPYTDSLLAVADKAYRDSNYKNLADTYRLLAGHYREAGQPDSAGYYVSMWGRYLDIAGLKDSARTLLEEQLSALSPRDEVIASLLRHEIACTRHGGSGTQAALQQMLTGYEVLRRDKGLPLQRLATIESDIAIFYSTLQDYDKAIEFYKRSGERTKAINGLYHLRCGVHHNNISIAYSARGEYDMALAHCDTALMIYTKVLDSTNHRLSAVYNNYSNLYSTLGRFSDAKENLQKALDINKANGSKLQLGMNYANMAGLYFTLWNLDSALAFVNLSHELFQDILPSDHFYFGDLYNLFYIYHYNNGEYTRAEEYALLSRANRVLYAGEHSLAVAQLDFNLGNLAINRRDYVKAREYLNACLRTRVAALGEDKVITANVYEALARCEAALGNRPGAIKLFEKTLQVYRNNLGPTHYYLASTSMELGRVYRDMRQIDTALVLADQALSILADGWQPANVASYPSADDVSESLYLAEVILFKNACLSMLPGYDTTIATGQVEGYDLALHHLEEQMVQTGSVQAMRSSMALFDRLCKEAIDVSYYLYQQTGRTEWVDKAYLYTEKTRAIQFKDILRQQSGIRYADIPDSLIKKEQDLKVKLAQLTAETADRSPETDTGLLAAGHKEALLKQEYHQLISEIEHRFPAHYQLKYSLQVVSTDSLQRNILSGDQQILQYVFTDSLAYLFRISTDRVDWQLLGARDSIERAAAEFRISIQEIAQDWEDKGQRLYNLLLGDMHGLPDRSELLIVPDDQLYYISFEALSTGQGAELLLERHDIRYLYSTTAYYHQSRTVRKINPRLRWTGFAPGFEQADLSGTCRPELGPLPWSVQMVRDIGKQLKGTPILGASATRSSFLDLAAQSRFIHLGTHALADDTNPMRSAILLAPGTTDSTYASLYAYELFGMRLQADCAVLTGCNTGIGRLEKAEGMVSLAKAFAYAGCPSLVVSLWSIDDEQSNRILSAFYDRMQSGSRVGRSLAEAKRSFLRDAQGVLRHPYYWSGLIVYGSDPAMPGRYPYLWAIAGSALLLLMVPAVFFLRRKRLRDAARPTTGNDRI